jgi:hypothetical protein
MKILVHAHTTFSNDGNISVPRLAKLAASKGFEGVMITEHAEDLNEETFNKLLQQCHDVKDCLMIPGIEKDFNGYHILAMCLQSWFEQKQEPLQWAYNAREKGALIVAAHPAKYKFSIPKDILDVCDYIEIWNSKLIYDGLLGPEPRSIKLLGKSQLPLCGQDIHSKKHLTSLGLLLPEKHLTETQIKSLICNGNYKMSNGVISYGIKLSPFLFFILSVFHLIRRQLVDIAIKIKKLLSL